MAQYHAPLRDMQFVLHELLDIQGTLARLPAHRELDTETANSILHEAARFSRDVIAPINLSGDREGCTRHANGEVSTPAGFKEAYRQYVDAGWPALGCDPAFGGQGLPHVIRTTVGEMFCAANQAWSAYPGLSLGAYECMHAHAAPRQKELYLRQLATGEWAGTMCLTEPQCGSDLGLVRTAALPGEDGSYAITGTKIFISGGEHDLTDNIIHLVLARLPGAPSGTKGISLFVVPKFIPDENGNPGRRNKVVCGSVEHKMGIHGNATCVMNFDGAEGWLVGEPNKGLQAMFVMMNASRLGVGIQCVGLADFAYQNSVAYARERLQMRRAPLPAAPDKPADPIIVHPDVRRMLLEQKAHVEASRALSYWTALLIDIERSHPDERQRADAGELVSLLTPVIKAFISDNTLTSTNLGMQVFGGHGYIHESGMEQYVRDARISPTYEGTNGIQALDLLGRKILADGGAKLKKLAGIVNEFISGQSDEPGMEEFIAPLRKIMGDALTLTHDIGRKAKEHPEEIGAASTHYLRVIGHVLYSYFWARMASVALNHAESGDAFYAAKVHTARFYFAKVLPDAACHLAAARAGAEVIMGLQPEHF